jgi:hypothetical protein
LKKFVKALYTLGGYGTIFVSKGKVYELYNDDGLHYIIDNLGNKMSINSATLKERFQLIGLSEK